ncbi:MAG: glycoside hydrolase, partial [Patescibacteria group bacterium]|nr:glycoside hydrolase [Patescibacteria group bacterium]
NDLISVEIDAVSGAFSVVDKRVGQKWASLPRPKPPQNKLRDVVVLDDGRLGFRCTADAGVGGGKTMVVQATLYVPKNAAELRLEIDMADRHTKITRLELLPPLPSPTDQGVVLFAPYANGVAVPVSDTAWPRWWGLPLHGDQPWVGLVDGEMGYIIIAETPYDMMAQFEAAERDGKRLYAPRVECQESKGEFGYPRRVRYCFIHAGGITAAAKQYRAYAKETGLLKTLAEKMKTKPDVAKLAGAPDIWNNLGLDWCREAKAAGIDRAIVNGASFKEEMEGIKSLGYLVSRYDNYEDCIAEGGPGHYTDVKIPDDCPLKADGARQQGWLTFDKKKQYMKRCSVKQTEVARRWIPKDLEEHPYNARFLDVTTATGLRECFDPNHPCTREEDAEAKRDLARYVGDELGLVLGGEHGRFWGADLFDYWEGMQSGGFYSWPAGHVGVNLPEKREDIGENYLRYGLGHQVRVPLWELVFGDCVVCTWYWGDSTGHLHKVAPELTAKKDVFNILYATVPLYWNCRPFGLNWKEPELRARLLESYRNTCKLHEVIGFEEMVGFEAITPDKAVQRSRFESGTVVTVNFGEGPFDVIDGDATYRLPQYGFHVRGPRVFQYKAVVDGRAITEIRTPGYVFGDGGGKSHDFGAVSTDGRVTLRKRSDGLMVNVEQTDGPVLLRPARCVDDWRDQYVRLLALDKLGEVTGTLPVQRHGDDLVLNGDGIYRLVYGEAGARPDLAIVPDGVELTPARPKQGESATVRAKVHNAGGPVKGAKIAIYLDEVSDACRIGEETIDLGFAETGIVTFTFDTSDFDGRHALIVVADPGNDLDEVGENDNVGRSDVTVLPDWSRWPLRVLLTVTSDTTLANWPVAATVDMKGRSHGKALDAASVRLAEVDAEGQPGEPLVCQWNATGDGKGMAWWVLPGTTKPQVARRFMLLAAPEGHGRFLARQGGWWNAETLKVTTPNYEVSFVEGAIRGLVLLHDAAPVGSVLSDLVTSAAPTGWREDGGKVTRLEVSGTGPVCCTVEVDKELAEGYRYTKRYDFFPSHFLVATQVNKPLCYSRAFYLAHGEYLDDKGLRAMVDGKGDAEGIAGKNANPQWYQFSGEGWAHSCVALTPFSNISYWDGGGQIGFTGASELPCRMGYVVHPAAPSERFGAEDARRLKAKVEVELQE